MSGKKQPSMKIYDGQYKELMTVRRLEKDGSDLVITGKIFGAMPMKARLRPEEARAAMKMLDLRTILFLLTLIFRKGDPMPEEPVGVRPDPLT
ncbi:MAG: hypothetical protein R3C51_14685 [Parvularculaceae bacterium]